MEEWQFILSYICFIYLTVPPSGPVIPGLVNNQVKVIAGQENEVTCTAIGAKPQAIVAWFKSKYPV